jgi:ribosomal protein S18 acetylase RimI-like enzyme
VLITTLVEIKNKEEILLQVEEIFFEASSLKEFSFPEKKASFYKRWCQDYQTYYPEEFFVMMEDSKVLGYLSGCSQSNESKSVLSVPGLPVFADMFFDFPAHLHINFHSSSRGRGLGSLLVETYVEKLKENHCKGLHLITSPQAPNISFYDRLGFNHRVSREFNGMELLFMGKMLD